MKDVLVGESRVLVLRGAPGVGKSAMLAYLSDQMAGMRVVRAAGVESEMELPYSGLHQLCGPLLEHLDGLPVRQRDALATVLGRSSSPAPDRLMVDLATLSLIAAAAEEGPLACVVDDAQWMDRASAQVLSFVARRLFAEPVALVCAVRTGAGDDFLAGAPEMRIRGLNSADARTLLLSSVRGPLDPGVADRIVAESHGNPLALLELPRTWTTAQLAGGFGLLDDRPVAGKIEQSYVQRLALLPPDTRQLVLTAAAEPLGDPALLRRAATKLGVDTAALEQAVDAGLLRMGGTVVFAHPLVRSAAYRSAPAVDRLRVHRALAAVTDADVDPDRRAWHRACGTLGPDEEVAAELERSAGRAQARGGLAAAAAFLTRATELTPDPATRTRRALDAALAKLRAGALDTARAMLAVAGEGPLDEPHHARMDVVRAQLALVSRRGNEAAPLLLAAARRLQPLDPELARETYLDAFSAAQFAARLSEGVTVEELARAARTALPREDAVLRPRDQLLQAFADLADDYAAAVPVGRRALASLRQEADVTSKGLHLLWQGSVLALELWDDEGAYLLSEQQLSTVRKTGALSELPLALSSFIPILVFCGELTAAAALVEEARLVREVEGLSETAYGALTYGAWSGDTRALPQLIHAKLREARSRREGIGVAVCEYARAVLLNGSGEYDEACAAALNACVDPGELVAHNWGLTELVESAARARRMDLATDAFQRLSSKALASGTEWALGMQARARALLEDGDVAEAAYREAIEHLARARVRAELARAHLLYGEWLLEKNRQPEAFSESGIAHRLFTAMGIGGFAERARNAMVATGASVGTRPAETRDNLTVQEAQIARLASDGLTNTEIGARLFISARTVEWHLRKVFAKLGVRSRRDLHRALSDANP